MDKVLNCFEGLSVYSDFMEDQAEQAHIWLAQTHPDDAESSLPAVSLNVLAKTPTEQSREAPQDSVRSGEAGEVISKKVCSGATLISPPFSRAQFCN